MQCTEELWGDVLTLLPAGLTSRISPIRSASFADAVSDTLSTIAGPLLLVGHSLGGLIAIAAARAHPDRVVGLALVSTSVYPPGQGKRAAWRRACELTGSGKLGLVVDELVRDSVPHAAADPGVTIDGVIRRMALETGEERFARQLSLQLTRTGQESALRDFDGSVLVLGGALDPLVSLTTLTRTAESAAAASLHIHPRAGHYVPVEDPEWTAEKLANWAQQTVDASLRG